MNRLSKWLALASLLTLAPSTVLVAQITIGNVQITQETGSSASCPTGVTWCGLGYKPSGGSTFATTSGHAFHDYVPQHSALPDGQYSQTWLNAQSTSNPTFTLCANSTTCYGSLVNTPSTNNWRQPETLGANQNRIDTGFYLTTTSTTKPITIQFGTVSTSAGITTCSHCISEFSVYWGSVDSWNTITFTDTAGNKLYFTGTQVVGANTTSITLGQNDIASFVYDFQLQSINGSDPLTWQSVSFSSTSAAFEFDNLAWVSTNCADLMCTSGATTGGGSGAPTPEPSSMAMFFIGVCGIARSVGRRR